MKINRDGLTPGERAVLEAIRDNPDALSVADLAERFDSTANSIKVMVARLRKKGHAITSPRFRDWNAKRLGVPQTYRLDTGKGAK